MKNDILSKIEKTKKFILSKSRVKPDICIIAGSGIGSIAGQFSKAVSIPYSKIPYFPETTVAGHKGELVLCSHKNAGIAVLNGRFHFYEGHDASDVIYPVRIMKALGVKTLIITAAAGAVNKNYFPGDIVFLKDHINFTGDNPLRGKNFKEFGERFPDMSAIYDASLVKKSFAIAKKNKIRSHTGIYFGVRGPSYETPAEIKAFSKLGGDVIGMSVVYEAVAAAQSGMKVLGISYVSNMAAGISAKPLNHREVLENGKKAANNISVIIKEIIKEIT